MTFEKWQQPKDGRKILLLVEKGFVLPPQSLATMGLSYSATDFTPRNTIATFTMSGEARFESQLEGGLMAITPIESGVISTPAIAGGNVVGGSFIQVMVDGQTIVENLRVITLDVGDIGKLKKYAPDGDSALLVSGDHYAVLDENNVTSQEAFTWRGVDPVAAWPGAT